MTKIIIVQVTTIITVTVAVITMIAIKVGDCVRTSLSVVVPVLCIISSIIITVMINITSCR